MKKEDLAEHLRQQFVEEEGEQDVADSLSDDEIIASYITCSGCGEQQIEGDDLKSAIEAASSVEHFFEIANKLSDAIAKKSGKSCGSLNHSSQPIGYEFEVAQEVFEAGTKAVIVTVTGYSEPDQNTVDSLDISMLDDDGASAGLGMPFRDTDDLRTLAQMLFEAADDIDHHEFKRDK